MSILGDPVGTIDGGQGNVESVRKNQQRKFKEHNIHISSLYFSLTGLAFPGYKELECRNCKSTCMSSNTPI